MTDRREPAGHPIRDLLSFFDGLYTQRQGTRYPFNPGKDAKTIKDLRAIYSDDEIRGYMVAFFEMDDSFIEQSGYSLGVFRGCLPKVIRHVNQQKPKADIHGHVPPCKTWGECTQRVIAEGRAERKGA